MRARGEKTEPVVHRPNCERPEACQARGAGHCRACLDHVAVKASGQENRPAVEEAA